MILFLFVLGLILGSLAVKFLNYQQKKELIECFSQSIGQMEQLLATQTSFVVRRIILANLKLVFVFWVFSIFGIGVVLVPGLILLRGFIIGFTVGFLVNEMFFRGIGIVFVAILPQNLLFIPGLISGGVFSVVFAYKSILKLAVDYKNNKAQILQGLWRYTLVMLAVGIVMLGSGLVEAYLTPRLISWLVPFLIE